ncbi:MAG: MobC family plasmid mobilization relaxosome protein [Actinobacteria bacterium]|nr:MobC family plasmid mobilization relaxosome protein [Actinomycetota bacterium]
MGRKRNNSLGIWLTQQELESLKTRISKTNINQSAYIRKCILEKDMTVIPGIRDLIIEIKRIGNNLNQITRSVNEGSLTIIRDDLKDIKEDLKKVWEQLAITLKKI